MTWEKTSGSVAIQSGSGPIQSGDQYYNADSLYWLSHIIHAESGNQPLAGKIAVGNVVLNRVNSPLFPNTVYEVVFQRNQFTPVSNGSIYLEPNAESVIAAKLCLDGANTAGASLYFVNPYVAPNSWASRNRPYVATIGAHALLRITPKPGSSCFRAFSFRHISICVLTDLCYNVRNGAGSRCAPSSMNR